jgi:predicted nucleotidyltransferase
LDALVVSAQLEEYRGYYYLPGKQSLVSERLRALGSGRRREKRLARFLPFVRHIPFVRGVALAGSQALGKERAQSDIDLLIVVDPSFLWLARTLVTGYFQLLGIRRHHEKIADRVCLNHYVVDGAKALSGRTLYAALEYAKLRPVVYPERIYAFQRVNLFWIEKFFPHIRLFIPSPAEQSRSGVQKIGEWVLQKTIAPWLERTFRKSQRSRIRNEKYIVVSDQELSFHPNSKQDELLAAFYQNQ